MVDVGESDDEIDPNVTTTMERTRKEVQDKERTWSYQTKSRSPTGMKQKHIDVKKKVTAGLRPMKRNVAKEKPDSGSKRRKVEKLENRLTRNKRNETL